MHAASWPVRPLSWRVAPAARRWTALRQLLQPASARGTAGCRAGTLPAIDGLAEACAPEGAIYVDGVLFGSRAAG
jgi:hypothetical protein